MAHNELIAVRAIIFNKEGKVLLAKRARGVGVGQWSLLGGKPNPGETLENATIREVQEESRLTITMPEHFLTTHDNESVPDQNWTVHFFAANAEEAPTTNEEHLEARYFAEQELQDLDIAFNHRLVLTTYFSYLNGR